MKKLLLLIVPLLFLLPHPAHAALTDNIETYYKLDESSGNASDATGNGNTLTNNSTTYSTGVINNAAYFSGASGSYLSYSSLINAKPLYNQNFTVNFWLKMNNNPSGTAATPFSYFDSTTANHKMQIGIQYLSSTIYINRGQDTQNDQYGVAQTLTTGTWYMLTYTYDGSTIALYLNGNCTPIVSGASTITGTNSAYDGFGTSNFTVGTDRGTNRPTNGDVDEVGYWSRTLTCSEITQLYNSGSGLQYPFSAASPIILPQIYSWY